MKNRLLYVFLAFFAVSGIIKGSGFGSPASVDSGCSTPIGSGSLPWPFNKQVEPKQRVPARTVSTKVQSVVVPPKELTQLHDAVNREDVDAVKALMNTTDVDVADKYGITPLHIAVIRNQPEVIKALLVKKHSAENLNEALYYAHDRNNPEIIEMLKKAGAFIPVEPNLSTLHVAARIGDQKTVSDFIQKGKDLCVWSKTYFTSPENAMTPLSCAIEQDQSHVIQQLLNNGVRPVCGISSALKYNKPAILTQLILIEAQSNHKPCSHFDLHYIISHEKPQLPLLEEIVKAGADVNMNDGGLTPLLGAVFSKNPEYVKMLLNNGASVHNKPGHGFNYLEIAIRKGEPAIVKMLIDAGIDVNQSDKRSFEISPLQNAVCRNNPEIVGHLLAAGARFVNINDTNPELVTAVYNNNLEIVKKLVEAGADVNKLDKGSSILRIAKRTNNTELIDYLVSKGAKTTFWGW